ncbi:hypothetical protein N2152v2_005455 [Parachlorella kessleri]
MAELAAIGALGLAGMWQGVAVLNSVGFPVPYYHSKEEDPKELLREWRRMFLPTAKMQAGLATLGALAAGTTAYLQNSAGNADITAAFGTAAACDVAIWAYTMLSIMPLNHVLLPKGEVEATKDDSQIRAMLKEWGRMHAVRTVMGGVALGGCVYGLHLMLKK